jgi:hypothetical protein
MKEILERLKQRSPKLFRQIQRICVAIISTAISVTALDGNFNIVLPLWVSQVCTYLIIAGTVAGGVGLLPVEGGYKNPTKKPINEKLP